MTKKKFKKIIIAGSSTFTVKNLGDEAMLLNMIQCLKKQSPKTKITLLCRHPSKKIEKLYGLKSVKNFEFDRKKDSIGKFFLGFNSQKKAKNLYQIKREFEGADAIFLGGNILMEIRENSFLRGVASHTILLVQFARLFGLKVYMFGINVVTDIKSKLMMDYVNFLSNLTEKVLVREKSAKDYLVKANFNPKKIHIGSDPAFGISFKHDDKIVKKICPKLLKKKKFIGVCIRTEYWKFKNIKEFYLKHAKILSFIAGYTQSTLVFIPNCFYNESHPLQDDRVIHKQIIKRLNSDVDYILLNKEQNIFENLNLISKVDFHITNRRHSFIFAALNNITGAIYDIKFKGHLKPLVKELNIEECLINFDADTNSIIKKIKFLYDNKTKIVHKTKKKIKILTKNARDNINYFK